MVTSPSESVEVPLSTTEPGELRIALLGAFQFSSGESVLILPGSSQRLLAFLALRNRVVSRSATAGALWPDASESHARGNLRSALVRLEAIPRRAVNVTSLDLALESQVTVDIRDAHAMANRLLIAEATPAPPASNAAAVLALSSDVLPDWDDEWATVEAAEWHELRVHALEVLAERLIGEGRFAVAAQAARAAIRADPLRETANATLIHLHLAEGNRSSAVAVYARFRALLHRELGIAPTPLLRDLIRGLRAD